MLRVACFVVLVNFASVNGMINNNGPFMNNSGSFDINNPYSPQNAPVCSSLSKKDAAWYVVSGTWHFIYLLQQYAEAYALVNDDQLKQQKIEDIINKRASLAPFTDTIIQKAGSSVKQKLLMQDAKGLEKIKDEEPQALFRTFATFIKNVAYATTFGGNKIMNNEFK